MIVVALTILSVAILALVSLAESKDSGPVREYLYKEEGAVTILAICLVSLVIIMVLKAIGTLIETKWKTPAGHVSQAKFTEQLASVSQVVTGYIKSDLSQLQKMYEKFKNTKGLKIVSIQEKLQQNLKVTVQFVFDETIGGEMVFGLNSRARDEVVEKILKCKDEDEILNALEEFNYNADGNQEENQDDQQEVDSALSFDNPGSFDIPGIIKDSADQP